MMESDDVSNKDQLFKSVKVTNMEKFSNFDEYAENMEYLIMATLPEGWEIMFADAEVLPENIVEANDRRAHVKYNRKTYSMLQLSLPPWAQQIARSGAGTPPSAWRAWRTLLDHFRQNDPGYYSNLSATVHDLTITAVDGSASALIAKLEKQAAILALAPGGLFAIPVEMKITILIRAIAPDGRYDSVVNQHSLQPYSGHAGYQTLCGALYSTERRLKLSTSKKTRNEDMGLSMNLDSQERKKRQTKRCSHCGKTGHLKEACWQLHPHLKEEYSRKRKRIKTDALSNALELITV